MHCGLHTWPPWGSLFWGGGRASPPGALGGGSCVKWSPGASEFLLPPPPGLSVPSQSFLVAFCVPKEPQPRFCWKVQPASSCDGGTGGGGIGGGYWEALGLLGAAGAGRQGSGGPA